MAFSGKRVLVTGGAGLIGSHLCERLLDAGNDVWCVDNLSSGAERNIAGMRGYPKLRMLSHDICEPFGDDAPAIDAIFNLACPAAPVHQRFDPVRVIKTTIVGAMNVLELARKHDALVLQASTSEIYGDPAVQPQPEGYWGYVNPIGPRSCYDEGKRAAEAMFFAYHRQHQARIKIARIFNTYGPRLHLDDGRVVTTFIMQALDGHPITIYGSGRQARSYTYVDDTVEGLLLLMASAEDFHGPVNIGNPEEFTLRELAETIIALTGSPSAIQHLPPVVDDPKQRQADIALAHTALGWQPRTSLREGLARTIDYIRALRDASR
jgi:UDP-glucuronate decarboxylase